MQSTRSFTLAELLFTGHPCPQSLKWHWKVHALLPQPVVWGVPEGLKRGAHAHRRTACTARCAAWRPLRSWWTAWTSARRARTRCWAALRTPDADPVAGQQPDGPALRAGSCARSGPAAQPWPGAAAARAAVRPGRRQLAQRAQRGGRGLAGRASCRGAMGRHQCSRRTSAALAAFGALEAQPRAARRRLWMQAAAAVLAAVVLADDTAELEHAGSAAGDDQLGGQWVGGGGG